MNLSVVEIIVGVLFFADWLFKSFVTGMFFGNIIAKKILNHVNKELDNCNYFGEDYGKNK